MTSSEVLNGSSKCLREIHCGSKVTSQQQSVEVKDFSSTGHTNSMAAVCEEAPGPLELGSFFCKQDLKGMSTKQSSGTTHLKVLDTVAKKHVSLK